MIGLGQLLAGRLSAGNITSNDIDRNNGIFLVSYSVESEERGWFSFLNFNDDEMMNLSCLEKQLNLKLFLNPKIIRQTFMLNLLRVIMKMLKRLYLK